jgi:polyhydroxybutyrate depolymerase
LFTPSTIVLGTLIVNGQPREYRMVVPRAIQGTRGVPVVIALHGALDTMEDMAEHTGLDELAVEKGFLLVYLQGRLLNWPPSISPENPEVMEPDFEFFRAMCDRLVSEHHADPRRIYLVGVSQGGAMANAVTAKCSERIAATVAACGWMPEPFDVEPLETPNKCPMLFLVGSRDRQVPVEFVQVGHDAFERAGHPVELRVIEGFGHGWPRAENERVWEFLSKQRLPEANENLRTGG